MASELNLGRVKGTDGAPGAPGAPGIPGKDGKSAYQAAVEKGYTGTEEEFNAALAGMQDAPFLSLSGGSVKGQLIVSAQDESNGQICAAQVLNANVTIMAMSDAAGSASMMMTPSGTSFTGSVSVEDPSANEHAVNKGYVDASIKTAIIGAIEGAY